MRREITGAWIDSIVDPALEASLEAGREIMEVYRSDFSVETKDDSSPLTEADRRSHAVIKKRLSSTGIPLLSEEGRQIPYDIRREWERLWIVDPLDGTKEFVSRNGEFTVNIALVMCGRPVFGVVFVPVHGVIYWGSPSGAFRARIGDEEMSRSLDITSMKKRAVRIESRRNTHRPLTIVASRSHSTPEQEAFVQKMEKLFGGVSYIIAGSSLKFCRVAESSADLYPRFGPTMEWDTAAGQAVCEAAGASVLNMETGRPLEYNKPDLKNPWFVVTSDTSLVSSLEIEPG